MFDRYIKGGTMDNYVIIAFHTGTGYPTKEKESLECDEEKIYYYKREVKNEYVILSRTFISL